MKKQCEEVKSFSSPSTELNHAFLAGKPSGHMTQQTFGASLTRRGFQRDRITKGPNKGKHGWRGLRLRSEALRIASSAIWRNDEAVTVVTEVTPNCGSPPTRRS